MDQQPKPRPRSPQSLMACDDCCAGLVRAMQEGNPLPAAYCKHRQTFIMIEGTYLRLHAAESKAAADALYAELHRAAAVGQAIANLVVLGGASPGDGTKPS